LRQVLHGRSALVRWRLGNKAMASTKERRSKIPSQARILAIILVLIVLALFIYDLFLSPANETLANLSRYALYASAGAALLVNIVVYYFQAKD
jgi:hypothetical protein